MNTAYAIGDVHGYLRQVQQVLEAAGLIDGRRRWSGGKASLVFLGDFVDRGPDGIGVIDLIMRLQVEAADQGGQVAAVLGNHDILLLGARWLGALPSGGPGGTFLADWLRNGGQPSDLERLSPSHVAWIAGLPAMLRWGKWLLVHADALVYQRYGTDVGSVNAAFHRLLQDAQPATLDRLLDEFSERDTFRGRGGWRRAAQVCAERLVLFGQHAGGKGMATPVEASEAAEPRKDAVISYNWHANRHGRSARPLVTPTCIAPAAPTRSRTRSDSSHDPRSTT